LRERAHDERPRGVRETLELFEVFGDMMPRVAALDRCTDEDRALLGRLQLDQGLDGVLAYGGAA